MTDHTDLIARLRAGCLPKGIASHWGDLQMEAADALDAADAEIERLNAQWKQFEEYDCDELKAANALIDKLTARLAEIQNAAIQKELTP